MASISLAEAVVQQTALIEEARYRLIERGDIPGQAVWLDVMLKALTRIDELCLKRMEQSTYEMLRRQQKALLAGIDVPAPRHG
jgi:hypothetical protein